jgi:DNA topoisomerase 2-associated protein PAT1
MGPGGQPVITHPQQLMELSEEQLKLYMQEDAKRAKRNHKIFLLSKGNGLMTPQDKNFITRIQLQQLVTATSNPNDPSPEAALAEDFYYQVFSQIRGAPRQHPNQPLGHFAQTYLLQTGNRAHSRRNQINGDNHMQRMQQQVQRAVEAAKLKPKNKQLIIEGSLGKISYSNAKTPKPLLNIKRQDSSESRPTSKGQTQQSKSDRKASLRNIETVYSDLMRLEDHERKMPPPPREGDADAVQTTLDWRQEFKDLVSQLWHDLRVLDPIVPGATETHPFIAMLSYAKMKKVIPRVWRLIDQEQRVTILTMIVVHLDQLDVVRNGKVAPGESQPPATVREDIESFSQIVMPCLLGYVSEAPINIMVGLLGLIMDHTQVVNVVQTKIGLGMLTMLLSRGELVKETNTVSEQDVSQWGALYNRFFDKLEPILGLIFPGTVNAGDDMYVWQFLAAVGIGANPEQQQRLVIGVKDRVMETVMQSKALPAEMSTVRLGNVNLFMRAIGLDVDMLG